MTEMSETMISLPSRIAASEMCRFCLSPLGEEKEMYRLPWPEWPSSELGTLYLDITGQELLARDGLTELYCEDCLVRLRQTSQTIKHYKEAERFWDIFQRKSTKLEPGEDEDEYMNYNAMDAEELPQLEFTEQLSELDIQILTDANSYPPFECFICHKEFACKEALLNHMPEHPVPDDKLKKKPYPCNLCERSFAYKAAAVCHLDRMHGGQRNCPEPDCSKSFRNDRLAKNHWKNNHDPNREQFCCEICNKSFNLKSNLYVHRKGHNRTMNDIIGCAHCDKTFFSKTVLKSHLQRVHIREDVQCPQCDKKFRNRTALRTHLRRHNEWKHECEVCRKRFHRRFDLTEHFRIQHTDDHPYVCATCGSMFRSKQSLDVHNIQPCRVLPKMCMRRHNQRLKPMLQCRSCDKKYTMAQTLKSHYRNHHPLDDFDAVACLICFQCCIQFNDIEEMAAHAVTHKKLKCSVCKNMFLNEQSLKNHMLAHSIKERPFTCDLCQATFVRQVHLNGHMRRRHTLERPFGCEKCDKRFVDKCELRAHLRKVHEKIKPHKCTLCDKAYSSVMMLGTHMIRHTGIGHKYSCEVCGAKFVNATFLNTHTSRWHNNAHNIA